MKWLQMALLLALGSTLTSNMNAQTVVDGATPAATHGAAASAPSAPPPAAPPLVAQPAPAPSREWLKAVYEQVADSVVLIETEFGTGSGFFFISLRWSPPRCTSWTTLKRSSSRPATGGAKRAV